MIDRPILSVVVIGRNEGERLTRCLESVLSIDPPVKGSIEIIYVDSASTDCSVERARQLGARTIQVNPTRPCAAVARNAGWRMADAAIVLFLDGDTILAPDFPSCATSQFNNAEVAAVFGDRREIDTDGSIYNRVLDLDWIASPGIELFGGDVLIRRDVLERVDGYDELLIAGEDAELCSRIRASGFKIVHLDRQMVGHDLAIHQFSKYWRRCVRTGYAYAEISERFRNSASPVWFRQARRNRIQGAAMTAILVGSPIISVTFTSLVPIATTIVIVAALSIRTAIRSRWKRAEASTLLLYGLHSHFAQIPILFGQLKYRCDRFRGRASKLIEYK